MAACKVERVQTFEVFLQEALLDSSALQWSVLHQFSAQLGEGLHWDASRSALWWVDIHGQRLATWQPGHADWREWPMPQRIGWALPLEDRQELLVGLQQGIARLTVGEPLDLAWVHHQFPHAPAMRLNDAKADRTGAVWFGVLNNDDESRNDGALYRFDGATGVLRLMDRGLLVPNGPAISNDGDLMLHTDSGRKTIFAFDCDLELGSLRNRRVWRVMADTEGYPDGMCFDAEGCVWVAHWGAGCVSRFTPEAKLIKRIELPATNITNVCFGGDRLDRLFVTSARAGLSPQQLNDEPLAGSVFELSVGGVCGLPGRAARLGHVAR